MKKTLLKCKHICLVEKYQGPANFRFSTDSINVRSGFFKVKKPHTEQNVTAKNKLNFYLLVLGELCH